MQMRRHWMASALATYAVAACGTESRGDTVKHRAAAEPAKSTNPEPWEPIDPAFDGCAGG